MRQPDYYGNVEKSRDKAAEILDKSGLAYFVCVSEKEKKRPYGYTHGKIGETHYSYELVMRATVDALQHYDERRQIEWLKFIGKKLGLQVEVTRDKTTA